MFCYPHRRIEEYMPHQTHPAIIRRLKRADGHLQTIIEMIENDRPCLLIAQQLQAVESAIESAKKALIHDHISNCLERPLRAFQAKRLRRAFCWNKRPSCFQLNGVCGWC